MRRSVFTPTATPPRRTPRRGFTLIEILVTITIIIILIGLLVPVIGGARETARRAEVRAEISRLDQALAQFKNEFGSYPPSGIALTEDADTTPWPPASMAFVRQMWPSFDFTIDRDLNQDGDTDDSFALDCRESMVFFIAGPGVLAASDADLKLTGFSKNPGNPFDLTGSSRLGPFFEFDVARLTDVDGDRLREFRDPLPSQTQPYLYLSSYEGTGYRAFGNDGVFGSGGDDEVPAGVEFEGYWQAGAGATRTWWKQKTFQIISPGRDSIYGTGGLYTEADADAQLMGSRFNERDNITNFAGGTLAPQ